MRIHSDVLTRNDFHHAIINSGIGSEGVYIDICTDHRSRTRNRAFDVSLASSKVGRRRNSGTHGARGEECWSATYEQHGRWMAQLYEKDKDARIAFYKNRNDFHRQTNHAFYPEVCDSHSRKGGMKNDRS